MSNPGSSRPVFHIDDQKRRSASLCIEQQVLKSQPARLTKLPSLYTVPEIEEINPKLPSCTPTSSVVSRSFP